MSFWLEQAVEFLVAVVATICFGMTFNVPRRHFTACGITGAVGWLAYCIGVGPLGLTAPAATLLAALPLTAAARLFAVRHRAPVTLFLLSGIFPLVPGAGIYYTAYYFLRGDNNLCAIRGFETLKVAVALALGIAMVCSVPMRAPGKESGNPKTPG